MLLISGDLSLNDLLYWTEASFYPLHITLLRNVKTLNYQRDFLGCIFFNLCSFFIFVSHKSSPLLNLAA